MITEKKLRNLIRLIEKPFLEKTVKDMEKFENQLQDEDEIDWNYWYQYFVKLLVGSAIISERAQTVISQTQPYVKEEYIDTLSNDVAMDILFEQWDKFCEECLDPAIKRTAKRLYDGRNIGNTGLITSKQEFKAFFNVKGDSKWIQFESGHKKFYYIRRIKDRCVVLKYSAGSIDSANIEEQIKFPFKPEEYEKFEKKIKQRVKAIQELSM